ncbi:MAG TPA: hypothetical protein DCS07_08055 [Bdellovibrionales bacterium]|nr:MAG: hypothetical protein A2Z97_08565 [Bdellovibrionales bacterium GWB1_52_6]OFZ02409.1 MAG: hypothetical protein A2X97_12730 [Bdellovibrionales bacterium GWA1_52_35]OFZ34340.1 MAG: hypothetical protein A2070_02965 [Bdellovibrionales bacterium GWC1_52_8]HAR42569.1 hypothetical protein [Bdellovibrionales bacterium]HCM41562.1 hypothetical protein [Bdellovibrionales bacterium]
MRPKTGLKQLAPVLKAPSFTTKQAARLGVTAATLAHYSRRGDLERLSRGVYRAAGTPPIEDIRWEDLVIAIRSVKDGVICLTSALAIYGLTEEIPRQHWIAIQHTTRHRAVPSIKVVRMRNLEIGKTQTTISGISVPIFDSERTIVDAFRYLSRETAIKALKMAFNRKGKEKLDLEKLRGYAKQLRVPITPYLLAVTT